MSRTFDTVEVTLASAVADAGNFTVPYPTGKDASSYRSGVDHKVTSNAYGLFTAKAGQLAFSFGASNITVTNNTGYALAAGTELRVQLDQPGADEVAERAAPEKTALLTPVLINLGAPDTADVDGVFEAFSGAAGAITLDGALASGGVVTFDVPRNIVVDSGGADTAVLTFTGKDEYGNTVVESITLNGTTAVAGKKAFKTITGCTSSATISNGAFAGPGDVLGLPVFVNSATRLLKESEDGAAPTAGTFVAGVQAKATATTGDVRGTYDPNSAADGSKVFELLVAVEDPSYKGANQYAG